MPIFSQGAASVRGFGFSAATAAPPGNLAISLYQTGKKIYPMCIAGDSAGNIYVGAYKDDGVTGSDQAAYVIKFSSTGAIVWQKQMYWTNGTKFPYRTFMYPNNLKVDSSGNVYIAFTMDLDISPFGRTSWIVKLNSSGTTVWQQGYYIPSSNNFTAMAIALNAAETAIYISGMQLDYGSNDYCYMSSVSTTDGSINWRSTYYGQNGWNAIVVQPNGNIAATGWYTSGSYKGASIYQWNSSGTLQWQKAYTNPNTNGLSSGMGTDSSNNVYMGYWRSNNYPDQSGGGGILKLDNSGTLVWEYRGLNNTPARLASTTTGDLYGWAPGSTTNVIAVTKWNSSGTAAFANKITAVSPTVTTFNGVSLGTSTTFLGVAQAPNGADVGGVVYRFLRDGTGTGGGTKAATPYSVDYSTDTNNIIAQAGFTLGAGPGSSQTNTFALQSTYTLTINNSSLSSTAIAL